MIISCKWRSLFVERVIYHVVIKYRQKSIVCHNNGCTVFRFTFVDSAGLKSSAAQGNLYFFSFLGRALA